ncbi:hypothetical protein FKP32DRAFT_1091575 [Trametes sanguinea]|nr:hypothetical protein FKP32DRAFT_1091575 [Trametes sanguinea]
MPMHAARLLTVATSSFTSFIHLRLLARLHAPAAACTQSKIRPPMRTTFRLGSRSTLVRPLTVSAILSATRHTTVLSSSCLLSDRLLHLAPSELVLCLNTRANCSPTSACRRYPSSTLQHSTISCRCERFQAAGRIPAPSCAARLQIRKVTDVSNLCNPYTTTNLSQTSTTLRPTGIGRSNSSTPASVHRAILSALTYAIECVVPAAT